MEDGCQICSFMYTVLCASLRADKRLSGCEGMKWVFILCRYPQLLNRSYVESVFSFRTTQKRRTVKRCIGSALCRSNIGGGGGGGFILECGWVPHRCGVGSGYMSIWGALVSILFAYSWILGVGGTICQTRECLVQHSPIGRWAYIGCGHNMAPTQVETEAVRQSGYVRVGLDCPMWNVFMFCFSSLSFAAGLFEGQGPLHGYQVGSWQLPVLDEMTCTV